MPIDQLTPLEEAVKVLHRAAFRLDLLAAHTNGERAKGCATKWAEQTKEVARHLAKAAKADPAREAYAMRDLHIHAAGMMGHELQRAIELLQQVRAFRSTHGDDPLMQRVDDFLQENAYLAKEQGDA